MRESLKRLLNIFVIKYIKRVLWGGAVRLSYIYIYIYIGRMDPKG